MTKVHVISKLVINNDPQVVMIILCEGHTNDIMKLSTEAISIHMHMFHSGATDLPFHSYLLKNPFLKLCPCIFKSIAQNRPFSLYEIKHRSNMS